MKTSRLGSIDAGRAFHRSRRLATSGRFCSEARRLFFERYAFMLEKMPKRIVADQKAAVGQLRPALGIPPIQSSQIAL